MTVSAFRTIVVGPTNIYGVLPVQPALRWPVATSTSNLDYTLNIEALLNDVGDLLATVSLSISPSGDGEMQALDLTAQAAGLITAQLANGVAARDYVVKIIATGLSGREFTFMVGIRIDSELAVWPLPAPPSTGFGTPITWTAGVTVFGPSFAAVSTGLTATGTNQATAAPLAAQTNVFATVPPGTGTILSGSILSGSFTISNVGANALLVYPPVDAQIGTYGVNVPVAIAPNQTVTFSAQNPTSQWYAQ